MFHEMLRVWFHWVEMWGYVGVFVLMAMESSIIPVPSEVVLPPAAFWAAQGRLSFSGVVIAATAGSYFGSVVSYLASRWLGPTLLRKYGKYFLVTNEKLKLAEYWVYRFGSFGIFLARLLPVVRHLISIPAGALKMPFKAFSIATFIGAGLWCWILSWFGQEVLGGHPELLQSPDAMVAVIKSKMHWLVGGVLALSALYAVVIWFKRKERASAQSLSFL